MTLQRIASNLIINIVAVDMSDIKDLNDFI
jgi:hypothetical protein